MRILDNKMTGIFLLILSGVLLSGCSPSESPIVESNPKLDEELTGILYDTNVENNEANSKSLSSKSIDQNKDMKEPALDADEGNDPILKTGLEATEPTSVSLASGEFQLVEFFAFW